MVLLCRFIFFLSIHFDKKAQKKYTRFFRARAISKRGDELLEFPQIRFVQAYFKIGIFLVEQDAENPPELFGKAAEKPALLAEELVGHERQISRRLVFVFPDFQMDAVLAAA